MTGSPELVSPWSRISGALSKISTATLWLAGAGLILMTAFVAWQVFGRYVLNSSPSWTEPGAVMLMSWFIFLGAAVGVRENYHLGFDVLPRFAGRMRGHIHDGYHRDIGDIDALSAAREAAPLVFGKRSKRDLRRQPEGKQR